MSARLLWVDDEIDLLRPHCLFLEKRGYDIATATNGNDAVELCRTQRFDLVLLDENMPGLSGLETLAAIKEVQPDVPVVMVTKNEAEDLMDQAIGAQIADYLLKPVNPMQILMALKKNIHRHEIVQEQTESGYRREFAQLALDMDAADDAAAWVELYKRLVHWELQLAAGADGAMADLLRDQKEEANAAFAKFVKANYADWVADADAPARPTLSPDVLRRAVFPRLAAGRRVVLLVLDNFRYDQWRVLAPELAADFDAEEQVYFSILPTATQYARNALFAGMMPLDIARTHPDLWVDEEAEEGKNLHEAELLERQLARLHRRPTFAYHKLNDSAAVDKWLSSYDEMRSRDLSVAVINFIDILSHARTESRMVRELASNEAAYRSITLSWFRHTGLRELFRRLAADDADVVLTTDHGSIRVDRPVKVVGDRNVNTNLRYKLGRNLSYPAKEVFEVRNPADLRLPAPNLSTAYIFATGARFFAYPNNYNYYVQHFRDTFQHGGVSMEEMIVPLITLHPKGPNLRSACSPARARSHRRTDRARRQNLCIQILLSSPYEENRDRHRRPQFLRQEYDGQSFGAPCGLHLCGQRCDVSRGDALCAAPWTLCARRQFANRDAPRADAANRSEFPPRSRDAVAANLSQRRMCGRRHSFARGEQPREPGGRPAFRARGDDGAAAGDGSCEGHCDGRS